MTTSRPRFTRLQIDAARVLFEGRAKSVRQAILRAGGSRSTAKNPSQNGLDYATLQHVYRVAVLPMLEAEAGETLGGLARKARRVLATGLDRALSNPTTGDLSVAGAVLRLASELGETETQTPAETRREQLSWRIFRTVDKLRTLDLALASPERGRLVLRRLLRRLRRWDEEHFALTGYRHRSSNIHIWSHRRLLARMGFELIEEAFQRASEEGEPPEGVPNAETSMVVCRVVDEECQDIAASNVTRGSA